MSSQAFTGASGTFTAPVAGLTLRAIGGGGAGGGATGNPSAGGGGAGGQYATQAVTVEPGDELAVVVGQAATGTTNSTVNGQPTSILPRNWATTAEGASISIASGGTFDGAIANLIDGVGSSYWMSDSHFGSSISLVLDLGASRRVRSFGYLDATDEHACTHFAIYAGNVGPEGGYSDAVQVYDSGTRAGGATRVDLASAVTARYWIWVAATDGSGGDAGSGTQIYLWELYGASVAVACVAQGGAGAPSNTGSGASGSATNGVGDTVRAGGNGANRVSTSSSGGGGGAAGAAAAGGNASGTTAGTGSSPGGNGGAGRTSGNVAGNPGVAPGGGGGGARAGTATDRAGGNGARGQAWIDWMNFGVTVKGRDVWLDASSLPGTITDYHWAFGDGVESAGASVDHTYLGQSTAFTVTLTVTYDDDSTAEFTEDITLGGAIYVAADGTSGGDGSIGSPYDMGSVFDGANTSAVGAGGTVWLRGGTYSVASIIAPGGVLQIWVEGAAGNPCVVRAVPGEHVVIDGPVLQRGQYSEFRGDGWIELKHSDPEAGGSFAGYALNAVGGRGINLVVHDSPMSGTFLKESTAGDELLDGIVAYNNGDSAGFDHGLYTWNPSAFARFVRGCLAFLNWGFGLHMYSETEGNLHDTEFSDCCGWCNGHIDTDSYHQDLIVSGTGATDITVTRNRSWHPDDDTDPYTAWLGDTGATPANDGLTHTDNYWVGAVEVASDWTDKTESGNTIVDPEDLPTSGQLVTVRPSPEAGGYGHVVIYNWADGATCAVDVSTILRPGDSYEVLHAHDLFGTPVASGTWDGTSNLTLPMTSVPFPTPIGTTRSTYTRDNPGTRFHVFVVRRTAQSYPEGGIAGAGAGAAAHAGAGTGTLETDATGTGTTPHAASGAAGLGMDGAGAGAATHAGDGDAALAMESDGTGTQDHAGSGDADLGVAAAGTGETGHDGAGNAGLGLAATGAGETDHAGAGDAGLAMGGAGTGAASHTGTAEAGLSLEGEGGGEATHEGVGLAVGGDVAAEGEGESGHTGAGEGAITVPGTGAGSAGHAGAGSADLALAGDGAGIASHTGDGDAEQSMAGVGGGQAIPGGVGAAGLALEGDGAGESEHTGAGTTELHEPISASGGGIATHTGVGTAVVGDLFELWTECRSGTQLVAVCLSATEYEAECRSGPAILATSTGGV